MKHKCIDAPNNFSTMKCFKCHCKALMSCVSFYTHSNIIHIHTQWVTYLLGNITDPRSTVRKFNNWTHSLSCLQLTHFEQRWNLNSPQISVHKESHNAQTQKCIFSLVRISHSQDNHRWFVRSLGARKAAARVKCTSEHRLLGVSVWKSNTPRHSHGVNHGWCSSELFTLQVDGVIGHLYWCKHLFHDHYKMSLLQKRYINK